MAPPPEIFILAGPNGAGKTTGAALVLPERFHVSEFVNADVIQQSLGPGTSPITAGRIMLERMRQLRDTGQSFAFETTLAAKTYIPFLLGAQAAGYLIHLAFISLKSPQLAQLRVADRVAEGGHDIPASDIERRYWRGLRNFFDLYCPVVNTWTLCDNSGSRLIILAQGGAATPMVVYDQERYDQLQHAAKRQP